MKGWQVTMDTVCLQFGSGTQLYVQQMELIWQHGQHDQILFQ